MLVSATKVSFTYMGKARGRIGAKGYQGLSTDFPKGSHASPSIRLRPGSTGKRRILRNRHTVRPQILTSEVVMCFERYEKVNGQFIERVDSFTKEQVDWGTNIFVG